MSDLLNILGGVTVGFLIGGPAGVFMGGAMGYQFGKVLEGTASPLQAAPQFKSPAYDFSPDRNTIAQDLPIPIIYGKNRVYGNIIRQEPDPVIPSQRMKYWVGLGEGPISGVSETRLNDKLFGDLIYSETAEGFQKWEALGEHGAVDHFYADLMGRIFMYAWKGALIEITDGPFIGYVGRVVAIKAFLGGTLYSCISITPSLSSVENGS